MPLSAARMRAMRSRACWRISSRPRGITLDYSYLSLLLATDNRKQIIRYGLHSERLGPLPLINHFIERIGLEDALARQVPSDQRCTIPHARALGVLLRSIIVEREPIYRQQETVSGFASGMFGIAAEEMAHLGDDRLGRALDRLFDADRAALITDVVLAVGQRFALKFDEFHNDSTTISFCGAIPRRLGPQDPRPQRPGHHLWPLQGPPPRSQAAVVRPHHGRRRQYARAFRCSDGNTSDLRTHIETWNTLRAVAGRADFLYVADSKLCSRENMDHIDRAGGRFVTVLPRSRSEDEEFRKWIQTHTPEWTCVWDRPQCFAMPRATRSLVRLRPFAVGGRLDHRLDLEHAAHSAPRGEATAERGGGQRRARQIAQAARRAKDQVAGAADIDFQIGNPRAAPRRSLHQGRAHRARGPYLQAVAAGRPGPATAYRKITSGASISNGGSTQDAIAYDQKSDGMYPLITNDRNLSPAQVLEAHKGQPMIEKRFEQIKSVHEMPRCCSRTRAHRSALHPLFSCALSCRPSSSASCALP